MRCKFIVLHRISAFYARKQLLLQIVLAIAILSVCPSVRLSVIRVDQSKTDHKIFTVGCQENSSFKNRKDFP